MPTGFKFGMIARDQAYPPSLHFGAALISRAGRRSPKDLTCSMCLGSVFPCKNHCGFHALQAEGCDFYFAFIFILNLILSIEFKLKWPHIEVCWPRAKYKKIFLKRQSVN
jgi:hypothetical protein